MSYASPFNVRVYGLLINNKNQILLSDEYRINTYMCKFPGGGLEYGEGTIGCLKREFREELNIEIQVESHFYTTDYFQKAQFFENTQLISIYYLISSPETNNIKTVTKRFDIEPVEGEQSFRWISRHILK
ncbi:NUDIX domain-containing protein [Carboxylicivirga sp. N1Y90]|uniref:NUDIX domain-containing protein n=1 Tax=Carboxylicivirga fragile TaxID=3417571 RepID=UPI003D357379|nr:NUDIX hydrolase [Marinilabiliaceae bacterium N1Y90]